MRSVLCGALTLLVAGTLTGCSDRTETEAAEDFVTAFNEGSLADERDLFEPELSAEQREVLTDLGTRCSIDPASLTVVETSITPHRKTFGAIADCDGKDYSVITGVNLDCSSGPECEDDYRVSPIALPGSAGSGSIKNSSLPEEIRQLDPLEPAPR